MTSIRSLAAVGSPFSVQLPALLADMIHRWFSLREFEGVVRDGRTVETVSIATYTVLRLNGLLDL